MGLSDNHIFKSKIYVLRRQIVGVLKRESVLTVVVLLALVVTAGIGSFLLHLDQYVRVVEASFLMRNEIATKFVTLHGDQITVMHRLFSERYQQINPESQGSVPLPVQTLADGKAWQVQFPKSQAIGTVTGNAPLPLSPQLRREIAAAAAMDAQIQTALEVNRDVAWLYYLSASGFIYIAPRVPPEQFQFTPQLYERDYWREASPSANPTRRTIMKGPYQDLAGQGWILTVAKPVYDGDTFLGITALDLRVESMERMGQMIQTIGESMLVSENNRVMAHSDGPAPRVIEQPALSAEVLAWREGRLGDRWLSSEIVKDELWLVHRLRPAELYWKAAQESVSVWLMSALLALSGFLLLRLRKALATVTLLTYTDPLTKALNRRGFYERSALLLAQAQRKNQPLALMIMDIDFFKKVNDTYGHDVGDSVLQQVGGYLQAARRPSDLFCRWGGEEFIVLLCLEQTADALAAAERMRQEAQRTRIPPGDHPVTLSAGLVLLQANESVDAAVKRADLLLYQAKQGGRNRIVSDLQR